MRTLLRVAPLAFSGFISLFVHGAVAQPAMGDVIATSHTGHFVLYLDRATGVATTLATLPAEPLPMLMAANNRDILVAGVAESGLIWSVDPTGAVTTVAQSSRSGQGNTAGMDWLQDGNLLTAHSQYGRQGWLRSVDLQFNRFTTLANPQISHVRDVCIDQETGDALVPRWDPSGDLLRFDLATNAITTIASGIHSGTSVDRSAATGDYVVSEEHFTGGLYIYGPTGRFRRYVSIGMARAVTIDDASGTLVVVTETGGANAQRILEYDANGVAIGSWGPYSVQGFSAVEIYGSRTVHGRGPATPGSRYVVSFSFPGFGGASYAAALSLSQRPGITLPNGTIHLGFDALFLASLQGVFVNGFQGSLNALGEASGSIDLPSFVPAGLRFFCAAVAVSSGNIITGNTIGITVQ